MSSSRSDPATRFAAVTPSDTESFTVPATALFVGVGGTVVAINSVGDPVRFLNVANGTVLPITTYRVNATNTTATDIVALSQ